MSTLRKKFTKKYIEGLPVKTKAYRAWDSDITSLFIWVFPSGHKTFYLRYSLKGRSKDIKIGRFGDMTLHQARTEAHYLLTQVKVEKVDLLSARKEEKVIAAEDAARQKAAKLQTFEVFMNEKYLPWAKIHLKTHKEIARLAQTEFKYLSRLNLYDITPWVVEKMVKKAKGRGLGNATINRRTATLKSIISKAEEWEIIRTNPLRKFKLLKVDQKGRVRYLTNTEEVSLFQAIQARETAVCPEQASPFKIPNIVSSNKSNYFADHLYPIVILALNTGMRRGEIFNLEWQDINFENKFLTVKGEGVKTSQTRHIPLNRSALEALTTWQKQSSHKGLVFPSPVTGNKLDNIKRSWGTVLSDSGIKDFTFHDLRHTFASRLVMAGVDLNTVRELLGHSSIEMTLRYAHLAPEHKAAAVEKVSKHADQ